MADSPTKPDRVPWPFAAAALVAFAALYITSKGFFGLIVLAVLLLASYFTKLRLPGSAVLGWTLRVAVWVVLIVMSPRAHLHSGSIFFEEDYVNLFGYLCAAELVQRIWTRSHRGRGVSAGEMLILTALVLTAASNTYSRQHIQILGEAYALCVIACLRSFPRRESMPPPQSRRKALASLRFAAAILAVVTGMGVVFVVSRYEYWITNWAVQFTRKNPRTAEIGLSTAPQLGRVFNPAESMDRVALISGPVSERHLRVMAFDTYEFRRWMPRVDDRDFKVFEESEPQPGERSLHFTILGNTFDLLLLPPDSARVHSDSQLERDDLGCVRQKDSDQTQYDVNLQWAADEPLLGPANVAMDQAHRERALTIPAGTDPRVLELAKQVVGITADPATRVMRLAQYLRSHHDYSLRYDPGDAEPLNDFILNHRAAHCQYFASAMVVMGRAVGIPARYVTGFYAHEAYGKDRMIIRGRDAHAWAECWIDGSGWITVDATPAGGRPDALFPDSSSRWRRLWEWLEDLPARIRSWLVMPARQTIILLLALPTGIIFVVWLVRTLLTRRRRKLGGSGLDYSMPRADLLAASKRFEKWLKQRGVPCAASRTWREHVTTLEQQRETCLRFIDVYDEARFGGGRDGDLTSRLTQILEVLKQRPSP